MRFHSKANWTKNKKMKFTDRFVPPLPMAEGDFHFEDRVNLPSKLSAISFGKARDIQFF